MFLSRSSSALFGCFGRDVGGVGGVRHARRDVTRKAPTGGREPGGINRSIHQPGELKQRQPPGRETADLGSTPTLFIYLFVCECFCEVTMNGGTRSLCTLEDVRSQDHVSQTCSRCLFCDKKGCLNVWKNEHLVIIPGCYQLEGVSFSLSSTLSAHVGWVILSPSYISRLLRLSGLESLKHLPRPPRPNRGVRSEPVHVTSAPVHGALCPHRVGTYRGICARQ